MFSVADLGTVADRSLALIGTGIDPGTVAPIDTATAYPRPFRASWTLSPDRTMMCGNPEWGAVMDVVVWLRSLGLGKYEAGFRENEIDETVLPSLTHETLKELGVTAVGHRLKLLDAIAALRSDAGAKAPPR